MKVVPDYDIILIDYIELAKLYTEARIQIYKLVKLWNSDKEKKDER